MDYFNLAKTLIENKAKQVLIDEYGAEIVECEICKKEHDVELSYSLGWHGDRHACSQECEAELQEKLDREEERESYNRECMIAELEKSKY